MLHSWNGETLTGDWKLLPGGMYEVISFVSTIPKPFSPFLFTTGLQALLRGFNSWIVCCICSLGWKEVVSHLKPAPLVHLHNLSIGSSDQQDIIYVHLYTFRILLIWVCISCLLDIITCMSLLCTWFSSSSGGTTTTWLERPITSWYPLHMYKMFQLCNVFSLPLLAMNSKNNHHRG